MKGKRAAERRAGVKRKDRKGTAEETESGQQRRKKAKEQEAARVAGQALATARRPLSSGPDGPMILRSSCGNHVQQGHTGPAPQLLKNAEGKYVCDLCDRTFARGFTTHRRFCAGRDWACSWCQVTQSKNKRKGPDGPATLCDKCGARFYQGLTGPAPQLQTNADGEYACDLCDRTFGKAHYLIQHQRSCAGRDWACSWCKATQSEAKGKAAGPDGPKTLCSSCGFRFNQGLTGTGPQPNAGDDEDDEWDSNDTEASSSEDDERRRWRRARQGSKYGQKQTLVNVDTMQGHGQPPLKS